MLKCLQLVCVGLLISLSAHSQGWQPKNNFLWGGVVNCMATNGSNVIFAGMERGIYKSTNSGTSWTRVAGLQGLNAYAIVFKGTKMFVGNGNGIYMSPDDGATFTQVLSGKYIQCLLVDGSDIYAGTYLSGVLRSTDDGVNWPVTPGSISTDVRGLVKNSTDIYAATAGGIFQTSNGGNVWSAMSTNGLGGNTNMYHIGTSGLFLFVGSSSSGYYRWQIGSSTNWTAATGLPSTGIVRSFASFQSNYYAATANGVYKSTNNGTSWSPIFPAAMGMSLLVDNSASNLFVGMYGSGVGRTSDGTNWNYYNTGISASNVFGVGGDDGAQYAGVAGFGIFRSVSQGADWSNVALSSKEIYDVSVSGSTVMIPSNGDGVFRSTGGGGGGTFSSVNTGLTTLAVMSIVKKGTNYFVGTNGGVFISANNGDLWAARNSGLNTSGFYWALVYNSNYLFAGSGSNGVYRSNNDGTSWTQINSGLSNTAVHSMLIDGTRVFAGTENGIFVTTNDGTTWTSVTSGPTGIVWKLAAAGNGIVACTDNGVFYTTDAGTRWFDLGGTNDLKTVRSVGVMGTDLFAGTYGNGLFSRPAAELTPTITSITPESAAAGSSVTITGNFNTNLSSDNNVFFGSAKASITAVSSTTLTVTVPPGGTQAPVSLSAFGLTGYSAKPFSTTFSGGGTISTSVYSAAQQIGTGSFVVPADLDSDGRMDLITSTEGSDKISIYLNNSSGSPGPLASAYATPVDLTTGDAPNGIAVGDLNGDGKLDIVVANRLSASVSVFQNTTPSPGGITFLPKVDYTTAAEPAMPYVRDLDMDGRPDIVVTSNTSKFSVLRNAIASASLAVSSFQSRVEFGTGDLHVEAAIADIDGDGKPDIMVPSLNTGAIHSFRNTSTPGAITAGSFTQGGSVIVGTGPESIVAGDLDADGKIDIVAGNRGGTSIRVIINANSPGAIATFSQLDVSIGASPLSVALSDLNGDGKPDVLVGSTTGLHVFGNAMTGTLSASSLTARVDLPGSGSADLSGSDIDGDGKAELLYSSGANVYAYRYVESPIPAISSFSPTSGAVGSTVTITGTNFSSTANDNVVYFGAAKANVTAATATQLTVTVPAGATYRPISVTTGGLSGRSAQPFNVTFSAPTLASNSFDTKVDFTTASGTSRIGVADFDLDGKIDVVTAAVTDGVVSVFRNTHVSGAISSSSFAAKADQVTSTSTFDIDVADLDGDGKLDFAASGVNYVYVFRNTSTTGTISFDKVTVVTNTGPNNIKLRDIDSDGRPDITVTSSSGVYVFRNTFAGGTFSSSSFAAPLNFPTSTQMYSLDVGDLDGDGKPDLVVGGAGLVALRNTSTVGNISFDALVTLTTSAITNNSANLTIADFDGDLMNDILFIDIPSRAVVLRNTSTPGTLTPTSFASELVISTQTGATFHTVADLNGDAKPDFIYGINPSLRMRANTSIFGSVSFASASDLTLGVTTEGIAFADVNGDNLPDILATQAGGTKFSVFGNKPDVTAPALLSVNPADGATAVSTNTILKATFDEAVKAGSGNITINRISNSTAVATIDVANPSVTFSGAVMSIDPPSDLPASTDLYINIPATAVTDLGGNQFAGITNTSTWNFTTGTGADITKPTVTTLSPGNNSTGNPINTNLVITFNEPVQKGTGTILIQKSSDQSTVQTIPVGSNSVSISSNIVTIDPADLAISTGYYVTIPATAFTDQAGNAYDGISTATQWSFSTSSTTDSTKPVITDNTPTSIVPGQGLLITATIVDPDSPVINPTLYYRATSVSSTQATKSLTLNNGNYTVQLSADEVGELGIEYKLSAASGAGTQETTFKLVRVAHAASDAGYTIPYGSFGSDASNFRIFAVPLELTSSSVSAVLGDDLGEASVKKWRVARYENGSTQQSFTGSIEPGKGYWLIVKTNPGTVIDSGPGTSVVATLAAPYKITLRAGWNQIGNPYNFNLSWADVQAANTGVTLPAIRVYNTGTFTDGTRLNKMEGGFINVSAATDLVIPVLKNASVATRQASHDLTLSNPIDNEDWEVKLELEHGFLTNQISGFGMRHDASEGFDKFDGFSMPRFNDYLELNHSRSLNGFSWSKDIVPTASAHVWEFSIATSLEDRELVLAWDNSFFGDNDRSLVLWNENQQRAIDMKVQSNYRFKREQSGDFRIVFGDATFIKEHTRPTRLVVHSAFPNPASEKLSVAFALPQSGWTRIEVIDLLGRRSHTAFAGMLTEGSNEVELDRGELPGGLYIVQVSAATSIDQVKVVLK